MCFFASVLFVDISIYFLYVYVFVLHILHSGTHLKNHTTMIACQVTFSYNLSSSCEGMEYGVPAEAVEEEKHPIFLGGNIHSFS